MKLTIPASEIRKLRKEVLASVTGYLGMQIKRNIRRTFYGGAKNFARGVKVYPKSGLVWVNRKYATVHEYGMVIVPRKKKALRFKPRGARRGQYVFAKRVRIPARPYVQPALDKLATKMGAID